MTLLVDTSVWSLALRRDAAATEPEVRQLKDALLGARSSSGDVPVSVERVS